MKFDGTIIITDPCYIALDKDWGEEKGFDYDFYAINSGNFSKYLWRPTGIGDSSWKVCKTNKILGQKELVEFVDAYTDAIENLKKEDSISNQVKLENIIHQQSYIGRFCVDSGSFGVFYLDEVLHYNPEILTDYGNWCYTIIPDFVGDVEIVEESDETSKILGVGNITFFTI